MSYHYRYSPFFSPSQPLPVEDGIKAKSTRGAIGESWWSRRFIDVLESFALGTRLTRGRAYARAGQVVSLSVAPGVVSASVQGSNPRPYQVTIGLAPFTDDVWDRLERILAEQAFYSAKLLAGELPTELEKVFVENGAPLFPASVRDLTMRCSCPDSAVPCKHIAATFYLMAESLDADPFELLHWRGRRRGVLLDRLRSLRFVGLMNAAGSGADAAAGPAKGGPVLGGPAKSGPVLGGPTKSGPVKSGAGESGGGVAALLGGVTAAPSGASGAAALLGGAPIGPATAASLLGAGGAAALLGAGGAGPGATVPGAGAGGTRVGGVDVIEDDGADLDDADLDDVVDEGDEGDDAAMEPDDATVGEVVGAVVVVAGVTSDPLDACLDRFWLPAQPLPHRPPTLETPADLLLKQLSPPGSPLGGSGLVDRLRPAYRRFGSSGE